MYKIKLFIYFTIPFLTIGFSCQDKAIEKKLINNETILKNGKWISQKDSTSGINILDNKLAFYKDWKFTSNDIHQYQIVDSLFIINGIKTTKSYLVLEDIHENNFSYPIKKKANNTLSIFIENEVEHYTFSE